MRTPLRRLLRNRRGGASVAIAVMMAMIVAIYYIHNILLWGQMLSNQDRDRLNEKIEITSITFPNETIPTFKVMVKNGGSVTARIVRMYLEKPMPSLNTTRYEIDPFYLDLERSKSFIISDFPPEDPVNSTDEFTVTVVTERGNSASRIYRYEPTLPNIEKVGEMGVFRVNWFYSKFTSENPKFYPDPRNQTGYWPSGTQHDAVNISKGEKNVAFYVKVKNAYTRAVAIKSSSFLALSSLQPPSVLPNLFIVKGVDYSPGLKDPKIYRYDGEEYVVWPGQEVLLIFAAETKGGDTWMWSDEPTKLWTDATTDEATGIQISLFYELSGKVHGQTISTQAVFLEGTKKS